MSNVLQKLERLSANDKRHVAAALELYMKQHDAMRRQLYDRLQIVSDKELVTLVLDETFFGSSQLYEIQIPRMLKILTEHHS